MSKNTVLTTRLGCLFDKIDDPIGDIHLPGTWIERLNATIAAICGNDLRSFLYDTPTWEGARVVLIGNAWCSRAILIHPEDPPGLVHLAKDDGQMINLTWLEAEQAVWLSQMLEVGYMSTYDLLDLGHYENNRLEGIRPSLV
jgi:hypothetical protein